MAILSLEHRNNSELIANIAEIGYLQQDVATCDPTYGLGNFWNDWVPDEACQWFSDLAVEKSPQGYSIDFEHTPYDDGFFPQVIFDPPYKLCLDDETLILTRRGWLTCDEVVVGDDAYSLDHTTGLGHWRPVSAVNVYPRETTKVYVARGRNLQLTATPQHRWPILSSKGRRVWKTTESLSQNDRVIHSAPWGDAPTTPLIADEMVELIAWF